MIKALWASLSTSETFTLENTLTLWREHVKSKVILNYFLVKLYI